MKHTCQFPAQKSCSFLGLLLLIQVPFQTLEVSEQCLCPMDSKCPGLNDTTPLRNANSMQPIERKRTCGPSWSAWYSVLPPLPPPLPLPSPTYRLRYFLLQTLSLDGWALREMSKEHMSPPPHRASKNLHPQWPHSNDYSDITSKTWHLKSENLYFKFGSGTHPCWHIRIIWKPKKKYLCQAISRDFDFIYLRWVLGTGFI